MHYLNVPYPEKDEAKRLGARFDPGRRQWYVPDGLDASAFSRWDAGQQRTDAPTDATLAAGSADNALQLSQLLSRIRAAIEERCAGTHWVIAEVNDVRQRGPHLYMELSQSDERGQVLAKARGASFNNQTRSWYKQFVDAVGAPPESGMKLLLSVSVSFHVSYGLTLNIEAIDANYTLGELGRKVAVIRQKLQADGTYDLQKKLPLPEDFTRIAVIAPSSAAGLGDFRREIDAMAKVGLLTASTYDATFQGPATEASILAAINRAIRDHQRNPVDALILLRGGGSQLDLDWLNNERIAAAVATAPLPVLVGIGHERDHGILDEVAARNFDTPSKISAYIHRTVCDRATAARQALDTITHLARARIRACRQDSNASWERVAYAASTRSQQTRRRLDSAYLAVSQTARRRLERVQTRIADYWQMISGRAKQTVSQLNRAIPHLLQMTDARAQEKLQRIRTATMQAVLDVHTAGTARITKLHNTIGRAVEKTGNAADRRLNRLANAVALNAARVDAADPARVLARGFALIRDADGRIVRSAQAAQEGRATATFADGDRSIIIEASSKE